MAETQYSDTDLQEALRHIANGQSVRNLARLHPGWTAGGLRNALDTRYTDQFARAKEDRAHVLVDDIIDLSDQEPATSPDGGIDGASVNWLRLRVDARKWVACKLLPRVYGDKIQQEHSGNVGLLDLLAGPPKKTDA